MSKLLTAPNGGKTIIEIGRVRIGGDEIILIAGPCAVESEEQLVASGLELKKSGVCILRASAHKPRKSQPMPLPVTASGR